MSAVTPDTPARAEVASLRAQLAALDAEYRKVYGWWVAATAPKGEPTP